MKVGLIQTGGIGDIIIALPIADFLIGYGHEIIWPIDERYLAAFSRVKPGIRFLGVSPGTGHIYGVPHRMLGEERCDRIFSLYSFVKDMPVYDEALTGYLKFDEYKYAITNVPFGQKWNLRLERDMQREMDLHQRLNITKPYICLHHHGSDMQMGMALPAAWKEQFQIVNITSLTDSPFDWIYTLENAAKLVLLDSCFSNLAEQLNLPNEKYLILRTIGAFTPVMLNQWRRFVMDKKGDKPVLRLV